MQIYWLHNAYPEIAHFSELLKYIFLKMVDFNIPQEYKNHIERWFKWSDILLNSVGSFPPDTDRVPMTRLTLPGRLSERRWIQIKIERPFTRAANDPSVFTITEKRPSRVFSWFKAPTITFTCKTLLDLKLGHHPKMKAWADLRIYSNHP